MSCAKLCSSEHIKRWRVVPICRIKCKLNEILIKAAKKRKQKQKQLAVVAKKPLRTACYPKVHHWNTNWLHGRITRSWGKVMKERFTLRLRYMCMPLLGDEHALEPGWEVHALSLVVEPA